jgi:hypothetical protein
MFNTSTQSSSFNASAPNIPDWLNNSIEGTGTAITNLGQRNPQDFVPGTSGLQQQAFGMASNLASRYGAPQPQYAQTAYSGGGQPQQTQQPQQPASSGGGLFESLGVSAPETPDYNSYLQTYPDVMAAYNTLTPQQRRDIAQVIGEPSGQITPEQFGQFHYNQHGQSEGRSPTGKTSNPSAQVQSGFPGATHTGGGQYRPGSGENQMAVMGQQPPPPPQGQQSQPGYSAAQNPLDMYSDAANTARSVINAGPNQVGSATTYNPAQAGTAQVQNLPGYTAASAQNTNLGPMAQSKSAQVGQMQGYNPTMSGDAQLGQMQGYNAGQAGQVKLDPTQQISGTSYDAAQAQAGNVQAQSLLTNLQDYMNPYINDVVDTTLAGYDENAGRIEAQQAAAAARNGAFGGSRYAVQEGITQGELARERAATESGLRSDAFNTGAGLSADDANRRQSASSTNASLQTQASLANQAAMNTARQFGAQSDFNAQQSNQQTDLSRLLSQGQLDRDVGLANQSATNSASEFGANAQNQGLLSQLNADVSRSLSDQSAANDASQFGANATNQGVLTQAGYDQQTGLANQDALNQGLFQQFEGDLTSSLANQNATNTASQFGASQTGQQYLTQAGLDQESGLYNAGQSNQAAQFNANSINDMNRFNASQADNALQRALSGADSLRSTGSTQEANERAAISLLEQLGGTQRGIAGEQANADIGLLSAITQMLGGLPLDQITGISGSGNESTSSSPGLLEYVNAYSNYINANSNAAAAMMGG